MGEDTTALNALARIQETVRRNQRAGAVLPDRASDMILVDRGELLLASEVGDRDPETLTEVPQDVFN